jgi:hypothetical protein
MIEINAFLAIFPLQILAMSVLHPLWVSRYVRAKATEFPADRFRQLYPGVDHRATVERHLMRYRVLNAVIALLGVWLWVWSFNDMRSANWDDGAGEALRIAYAMLQLSPLLVVSWYAVKYGKLLKRLPEGKRTAVLQRRGLFDFVSPFAVSLAVLAYLLFIAYMFYIARHPFPGFAGPLVNIFFVTLQAARPAEMAAVRGKCSFRDLRDSHQHVLHRAAASAGSGWAWSEPGFLSDATQRSRHAESLGAQRGCVFSAGNVYFRSMSSRTALRDAFASSRISFSSACTLSVRSSSLTQRRNQSDTSPRCQ